MQCSAGNYWVLKFTCTQISKVLQTKNRRHPATPQKLHRPAEHDTGLPKSPDVNQWDLPEQVVKLIGMIWSKKKKAECFGYKTGNHTRWLINLGCPFPCGPAMCERTDISGILSRLRSPGNFLCMTEWFHYETQHTLGGESLSHSRVDSGHEGWTGGPRLRLEGLWQCTAWTARLWCAWRAGTKPGFVRNQGWKHRVRAFFLKTKQKVMSDRDGPEKSCTCHF